MNTRSLFPSLTEGYGAVYAMLAELRESFHRSGRLDDSNAKLDEIAKLFATYLAFKRGLISSFPEVSDASLVPALQDAFRAAAALPQYRLSGSHSIFGERPALALRPDDAALAIDLVNLVRRCLDLAYEMRGEGEPFDILNEAFGHFVRDNFRGNVEDAQYMTPPEVVDFMADIALHDLRLEVENRDRHWTVLDPSCGVGSFLTSFYHKAREKQWPPLNRLRLFGQDKVDRMARLATINLELFDAEEHSITVGNSLGLGSSLDPLNGQVDVILTNPPFGARFPGLDVRDLCGDNTPFFSSLKKSVPTVDSELLFIDRNLRLLRDGGLMLIVVPDGVVSARGTPALLRQHLGNSATLKAVIELPSVTFGQAGTRTKTSILYLQKGRKKAANTRVFMGVVEDLGFQVSSRKGVQFKQTEGNNELPTAFAAYLSAQSVHGENDLTRVISREPSCVSVVESEVLRASWTPSHYSARRLDAISAASASSDFELVPLSRLVDFCADNRRNTRWEAGMAFLSVLHVLGEGFVDVAAAHAYSPKTPGIPTFPGEVLLSRINPRIPRVCIVPDLGRATLCSSEFEVMRPKDGLDPFLLAYLLLTDAVQSQVRSLTSGTSASHNRIRTSELATVLIPIPRRGTELANRLNDLAAAYGSAIEAMNVGASKVAEAREAEASLFFNVTAA